MNKHSPLPAFLPLLSQHSAKYLPILLELLARFALAVQRRVGCSRDPCKQHHSTIHDVLAVLSDAPIVDDTAAGAAWVRPYETDGEVQPEPEPELSVAQK